MSKPKLSTKTPDATDTNALIESHPRLIEHFNSRDFTNRHIALVEYAVTKVDEYEGGERQATIVTRQIELLTGANETAGEKLFTKAYRERTGNSVRPTPDEAPTPDTPLAGMGDEDLDDDLKQN